MRFIFNADHLLDIVELSPTDSIQSICDTLQSFLDENPLNCDSCRNSCCRLFPIRPDNVFIKKTFPRTKIQNVLAFKDRQYTMPFIEDSQGLLCEYNCSGKCSIYQTRPVICRLYTCLPVTEKWSSLLDIIAQSYKNALEYEIMEQTVKSIGNRGVMLDLPEERSNPALYADDYAVQIGEILNWAQKNDGNEQQINFYS